MSLSLPPPLDEVYEVVGTLGQGGFGRIYEVRRRKDGARRALKVIPVTAGAQRLEREIAIALDVKHPHFLACEFGGVVGDHAYLDMQVAECSLRDQMDQVRGAVRVAMAPAWKHLRDVAWGLAELGARGLIHRDLKPANILIVGGRAKIADLGLASGRELKTLTATGVILGTPRYMAPEQARGAPLTPACDVFAVGAMFFELLEGDIAWAKGSPIETVMRLGRGDLAPLKRAHRYLSARQLELVQACLDPDPTRRPSDLEELASDLGELEEQDPDALAASMKLTQAMEPRPAQFSVRAPTTKTWRPVGGSIGRLAAVGIAGGAVLFGLSRSDAPTSPKSPPSNPDPVAAQKLPSMAVAMARADALYVDRDGVRYDESKRPDDSASMINGDPMVWADLVEAVPELREALRSLRERPDLTPPTESERAAWAQRERAFLERGLPGPFLPILDPRGHLFAGRDVVSPSEIARTLYDDIGECSDSRLDALRSIDPADSSRGAEIPANLRKQFLVAVRPFFNKSGQWLRPDFYWMNAAVRQECVAWIQSGELVRRALRATAVALRGPPRSRDAIAAEFWINLDRFPAVWASAPLTLHPAEALFGVQRDPGSPAEALALAALSRLHGKIRGYGRRSSLVSRREYLDLLTESVQHDETYPEGSFPSRAMTGLVYGLRNRIEIAELPAAQAYLCQVLEVWPGFGRHEVAHLSTGLVRSLSRNEARVLRGPCRELLEEVYGSCTAAIDKGDSRSQREGRDIRAHRKVFAPD